MLREVQKENFIPRTKRVCWPSSCVVVGISYHPINSLRQAYRLKWWIVVWSSRMLRRLPWENSTPGGVCSTSSCVVVGIFNQSLRFDKGKISSARFQEARRQIGQSETARNALATYEFFNSTRSWLFRKTKNVLSTYSTMEVFWNGRWFHSWKEHRKVRKGERVVAVMRTRSHRNSKVEMGKECSKRSFMASPAGKNLLLSGDSEVILKLLRD
jgi:hypothetical protein